ncbi:lipid II flippase MurJ [Ruminococcus bicirculans (ex Wegman et al. 2014)]|uniref:lipid II flippase MurJ n=1 Tax=Ruminococcus bicirculans (ex Wegman et al. 2014) TaxID=1160721 RepID=UPI004027660B
MFGKSILPSLAESCAKNDKKAMQSGLTKMLIVTSIIAIPAGMGIAVLSEPILRFLFGGRETEIQVCIMPMSILGIAVIFLAIATPCFSILQTLGKPHKAIIIMLAGGIIKLFLNIILIRQPIINISGAAISTLVSEVFICVLSVRSVCKMADLKPKVSEIFVKPTYAAIMCSVTAVLSHETLTKIAHLQINHRFVTLFSIGIGSTMYFFCLYLLCETPKNIVNYIFSKKNPQNP